MRIYAFDLDNTLVNGNISKCFCFYLYKKGVFSFFNILCLLFYYVGHCYFKISLLSLHEKVLKRVVYNKNIKELRVYARDFVKEKIKSLINKSVFDILKRAKDYGDYVMILSSSPVFLVEEFANFFAVDDFVSILSST